MKLRKKVKKSVIIKVCFFFIPEEQKSVILAVHEYFSSFFQPTLFKPFPGFPNHHSR